MEHQSQQFSEKASSLASKEGGGKFQIKTETQSARSAFTISCMQLCPQPVFLLQPPKGRATKHSNDTHK